MNEAPIGAFQEAIRATHGAQAVLAGRERVHEQHEGETVWIGEVLIFTLEGRSSASKVYAWEVDGTITAILHAGPIDSPAAAVRASILAEAEGK